MDSLSKLPFELQLEILLRIPLAQIWSLRQVCYLWYWILQENSFWLQLCKVHFYDVVPKSQKSWEENCRELVVMIRTTEQKLEKITGRSSLLLERTLKVERGVVKSAWYFLSRLGWKARRVLGQSSLDTKRGTTLHKLLCWSLQKGYFRLAIKIATEYKRDVCVFLRQEVDKGRASRQTALYLAACKGETEVLGRLLEEGNFDPCLRFEGSTTLLYAAARRGRCGVAEMLLERGASVDQQRENGATPLYIASYKGHTNMVFLLLAHKANVNLYKSNGVTPLYVACQNGAELVVEQLLNCPHIDVNAKKTNGATPLLIASSNGHDRIVKKLLTHPATLANLPMKNGTTALDAAAMRGFTPVVHLLLNLGELK
jgi:hypothetical protein